MKISLTARSCTIDEIRNRNILNKERFSQIDAGQLQQEMAKITENNGKILPGIKK